MTAVCLLSCACPDGCIGQTYNMHKKLIMTMREKVEWQSMEDDERVAAVLSYACRDDGVGRGVEKMWQRRFFDRSLTVPAPPPSADP